MDTDTSFEGPIEIGAASNLAAPGVLAALHARFVQYPGCQQLQLWLPRSGRLHDGELRVLHSNGAVLKSGPLGDHLNGAVQLLMDTLPWPPGEVRIEIDCTDGVGHRLVLRKHEAGYSIPAPPVPPEPASSEPTVYRDGFGRVLEDHDLKLRETVLRSMADRFSRRLEYTGDARAGVVTYVEGELRIGFPHEMCGGALMFCIDIPGPEQWEASTGTMLARRDQIVEFVAQRVHQQQAPSCRYRVKSRSIEYFRP